MLLFIPTWMCTPSNLCLSIMASLLTTEAHFCLLTYTGGKYILFIIYKRKVLRGLNKAEGLVSSSLWKQSTPYSGSYFSTHVLRPTDFSWLLFRQFSAQCFTDMTLETCPVFSTDYREGISWNFNCVSVLQGNWKGRGKQHWEISPRSHTKWQAQLRKEP